MPNTNARLLRMLAETFARLEASGRRLEAIDIVARIKRPRALKRSP